MAKQTLREAIEAEIAYMHENHGAAMICQGVAVRLGEILARFPKSSEPTARVRCGVEVDKDGCVRDALCLAVGQASGEVWASLGSCGGRVTFIEIDVPLPEAPVTLHAEVLP